MNKKQKKAAKNRQIKEEKMWKKLQKPYQDGKLNRKQLSKLSWEKQEAYYISNLHKKFPKSKPLQRIKCSHCAAVVLFNDHGYLSDEDILNITDDRFQHV